MDRLQEIESRKAEIRSEIDEIEEVEKVEELTAEVEALDAEKAEIEESQELEQNAEELEEDNSEAEEVSIIEENKVGGIKMETRNSKAYIDAYASYIKEGLNKNFKMSEEERALLTTNVNDGVVAVPDMVDEIIKTAWEREELMRYVRTISVKGNFQVQFEVSATPAEEHEEGNTTPVTEEELILGIVTLTPKSIKKWISVSDEVLDMKSESFLEYIYDELTYRIAKKSADLLVGKIAALPQTLTANAEGVYDTVSAAKVALAPSVSTIASAYANLSDEANNVTIVMNKLTYAAFKEAQYANGYGVDVFEGFRVVFNNTLPAYNDASAGAVYAIVGDFGHGALANYPAGDDIELKYDDKTLMTTDLVRILGRRFGAIEAVADKAFVLLSKPNA